MREQAWNPRRRSGRRSRTFCSLELRPEALLQSEVQPGHQEDFVLGVLLKQVCVGSLAVRCTCVDVREPGSAATTLQHTQHGSRVSGQPGLEYSERFASTRGRWAPLALGQTGLFLKVPWTRTCLLHRAHAPGACE